MIYTVLKQSGTYAETLEWLGFSYFLEKLCHNLHSPATRITLNSEPDRYTITVNRNITQDDLAGLPYFWVLPFIRNKDDVKVPDDVPNEELRDFPNQKRIRDEQNSELKTIQNNKQLLEKEKIRQLAERKQFFFSELSERKDLDYDVYSIICGNNPYPSYLKLHDNFYTNKIDFAQLVWEILTYYTDSNAKTKSGAKKLTAKVTAQQLYSPYQGKGLNREKADGPEADNIKNFWIPEVMKVSGALRIMFIQKIKVGQKFDTKINVPEFNQISLSQVSDLLRRFKKSLRSSSIVKVDILNVLTFIKVFIENSPEYKNEATWRRIKISESINGFYVVLQKKLGNHPALPPTVINMSFIGVPTFISYHNYEEAHQWVNILGEQATIIRGIEEQGDSLEGLQAYRSFLSGSDLNSFFRFSTFYATYLTHELAAEHYYVKPFKTEHLNQFFNSMSTETLKLEDIITNPGFISVARAIRNSTIRLQFKPKKERNFNVRYGLSQELQTKSKSTDDLATFIGEFVSSYNTETARSREKLLDKFDSWNAIPEHLKKTQRSTVEDDEIASFYMLLNKYEKSPRLIGAMLAAYGFARTKWDATAGSDSQNNLNMTDNVDADEATEIEETDLDS